MWCNQNKVSWAFLPEVKKHQSWFVVLFNILFCHSGIIRSTEEATEQTFFFVHVSWRRRKRLSVCGLLTGIQHYCRIHFSAQCPPWCFIVFYLLLFINFINYAWTQSKQWLEMLLSFMFFLVNVFTWMETVSDQLFPVITLTFLKLFLCSFNCRWKVTGE